MENIVNYKQDFSTYPLMTRLFLSQVSKMSQKGCLTIKLPDGNFVKLGSTDEIHADIEIKDRNFFKQIVLFGDIGFGEAYVDGYWETSSIKNVIQWFILNIDTNSHMSGGQKRLSGFNLMFLVNKARQLYQHNSKKNSKKNISYHYDLSNDFYKQFLDPTMTYSSALYQDGATTLESAQIAKYESICQNLELKHTDHVLEIGCGWGGFASYAAKKYGCKITGVTLSKEQLQFANERMKREGLDHLVTFEFRDYRDIQGKFDKIASIEMMEAIGHQYLPDFFKQLAKLLKQNGIISYQVITSPDSRYQEFVKGVDWIQKHIFPGSLLPAVGRMQEVMNKNTDLQLHKFKDMGIDYAKTLDQWNINFHENWNSIKEYNFDERFKRMWRYYLEYCSAAFTMRNISVVQMTLTRPNNTELA